MDQDTDWSDGVVQPGGVWEIDNGWDVVAADGEKVGDVEDVHPHYLVVGKGFIFHTERYVPVTAITNVERERVYLNVSSGEIDGQGWERIPDHGGDSELEHPTIDEDLRFPAHGSDRRTVGVSNDLPPVDAPLREEEIRVQRHPIGGGQSGQVPDGAFREVQIEIPIRGEEVVVTARPVVREQVEISRAIRERRRDSAGPAPNDRAR